MAERSLGNTQLGKQGVTDNFIITLRSMFKNHRNVKVSVLKSARPAGKEGRDKVIEYKDKVLDGLGVKYTAKIIGFTITIKKWRKAKR